MSLKTEMICDLCNAPILAAPNHAPLTWTDKAGTTRTMRFPTSRLGRLKETAAAATMPDLLDFHPTCLAVILTDAAAKWTIATNDKPGDFHTPDAAWTTITP